MTHHVQRLEDNTVKISSLSNWSVRVKWVLGGFSTVTDELIQKCISKGKGTKITKATL
jgi:hypothetical protein